MARLRIKGPRIHIVHIPPARKKARERWKAATEGLSPDRQMELRREVAAELERRTWKLAFQSLTKEARKHAKGYRARIEKEKEALLRAADPDADDETIRDRMDRSSIDTRAGRAAADAPFVRVVRTKKIKVRSKTTGKLVTRHVPTGWKRIEKDKRGRWVATGKILNAGSVKKIRSMRAHFGRVRSVYRALGLDKVKGGWLLARRAARHIIDAPDSMRRRVSNMILRRAGLKR